MKKHGSLIFAALFFYGLLGASPGFSQTSDADAAWVRIDEGIASYKAKDYAKAFSSFSIAKDVLNEVEPTVAWCYSLAAMELGYYKKAADELRRYYNGLLYMFYGNAAQESIEYFLEFYDQAQELYFQAIKNQGINSVNLGIDMVKVSGGSFNLGAGSSNIVKVSGFSMSSMEITLNQWLSVMGYNEAPDVVIKGFNTIYTNIPAQSIVWADAINFCNSLSELDGLEPVYFYEDGTIKWNRSANGYRLPTEAEWEFAARGGVYSKAYAYPGSNDIKRIRNTSGELKEVGSYDPNELGLYDMGGNVAEWCRDWYGYYTAATQPDPQGPATGDYRVFRGGHYRDYPNESDSSRVTRRDCTDPAQIGDDNAFIGFRIVRNAP